MTPPSKAELVALRQQLDKLGDTVDLWVSKYDEPAPTPVPPQPSAKKIKYALHKYDNKTATNWAEFDYYDLQRGYTLTGTPRTGTETYVLSTWVRNFDDPLGLRQFMKPVPVPDSWMCHDKAGNLIRRTAYGNNDTLANFTHPDWQAAAITNIIGQLKALKLTGLYHDEIDWTWVFAWQGNSFIQEFPDEASWQKGILNWLTALSNALHANGLKLWINLGANYSNSDQWQASILKLVDAINIEFYVGREGVGAQPNSLAESWPTVQTFIDTVERVYKKPVHVHCSSLANNVVAYAFTSWLLCTDRLGSFTASTDYGGRVALPPLGVMNDANALGDPTSIQSSQADGTWLRTYQGGEVRVNASNQTRGGLAPLSGKIIRATI